MSQYATEVKLFGKWSFEDVEVKDMSLEDYIACRPKYAQFLPHSSGRWQKKRFRKALCPIVERLVCSMMMHGRMGAPGARLGHLFSDWYLRENKEHTCPGSCIRGLGIAMTLVPTMMGHHNEEYHDYECDDD